MAQRKAKPDTNPQDDPIVFESLDGSPDQEPEDLTGVYADPASDDGDWQPPEEEGVAPRHPLMTEQGDEEELPEEGEDEGEGEDAGDEDAGEELETAGEAEEQDREAAGSDVDDDLKNLPQAAQDAIMAARREAREKDAEVQRYRKLEYDYHLGRAKEQEQGLGNQLERQRADLRQAIEDGDTEKQVKLTEEIADTKSSLREWSNYRNRLEKQGGPQPAQPQGQQSQQPQGQTAEANKWLQQNTWFDQPGYEEVSKHVRTVDGNLFEEGYDPNSPAYFAELNRRVKARFPDAPVKANGKQPARTRTSGKRSPVAAPDKGSATPSRGNKRGKVTLNAEDRSNMRRFGLDPNNAEHAKIYAQEKRSSERREQRQRGR